MDLSPMDWEYADERAGSFVGREWVFAQIRAFLSGSPGSFLLHGDPGTGKTAIAARLVQASCGHPTTSNLPAQPPVAEGTISAAVFCRAGRTTVQELIQKLSRQLEDSVQGFSDSLQSTLAPQIKISGVQVEAHNITGDVTGVRIVLNGEEAFHTRLAAPLRQLRESGAAQQIVLLVDAVDEAVSADAVNTLSRLLSKLDSVHLIVTCRPDSGVLFDFRDAEYDVDLIADSPPGDNDVHDYVYDRLQGKCAEDVTATLADRIAKEAVGNFLYAFYVIGTLIQSGSLAGIDSQTARTLPLPAGGLAGVYGEFLDRQIGGDEAKWAEELSPVLAPLSVALGDGFTTAQLKAIASRLVGQGFSLTKARHVTRLAGQFLDGPRPDGPFRLYHQSFSRFLTDPKKNPWPIDLAETNDAVVRALMPEGRPGARDWTAASTYVRRHLASHAAAAGILDDLLVDRGYLLAADPSGLFAVLSAARSPVARRASAAYRRVAHRLADPWEPARNSYLRLAALQTGANGLLTTDDTDTGPGVEEAGWSPAWGWWRPATAARIVGELPSTAVTLAALVTDQGSLALVGGEFGLHVWNLDSGQRLAAHPKEVISMAVGEVGGQPVVLAGHNDGIVTLHALPSLEILAHDEAAHAGRVLAAVIVHGRSIAATGDEQGTLVLWQLPALHVLATRPKAHTMVRAFTCAASGNVPLLISVGDTFEPGHRWDPNTKPVRAWTLPGLHLYGEIETGSELSEIVVAASTTLGCAIVFQKGTGIDVQLIDTNGSFNPIGTRDLDSFRDLLVLGEGEAPQIMVCGGTLALLRISFEPEPTLTLGTPVETEDYAHWAGPIGLNGRPCLVSATRTLRIWDLEEVLAASSQQATLTQRRTEYQVGALAVAGNVLAALTGGGAVHRWRWHSAEAMEPLPVRTKQIMTLASCVLAERPHFVVAYGDGIVEAFDAESGERWAARIDAGAALQAMTVGQHNGRTVVATAVQLGLTTDRILEEDRPLYGVRLWDLMSGAEISTRWPDWLQLPEMDASFIWKLTVEGYGDKQLGHLAAVEAADGLLIAANNSRILKAWPLNDLNSGFDVGPARRRSISALAGQHDLLAIGSWDGLELWCLGDRANCKFTCEHQGVTALAFGSWQGAPALFSGGRDGWLRVWSQNGAKILGIDIGEPVTCLAFLPGGDIAVGTSRGIVIFRQ